MRFGIYSPWTYTAGGTERVSLELLRRSKNEWTLYTHRFDPDSTYGDLASQRVVELTPRLSAERSLRPIAQAAWTISRTVLPSCEALLVSSDGLADLIVTRNRFPAVCYCHTPLKIFHNPEQLEALRRQDPRKAFALRMLGPGFMTVDRRLWRRYEHVFVASNEVASRIERAKLAPRGPVEIVPPGVDLAWFTDDGRARDDFFLVVGRIKWWKNIELAIAGFERSRGRDEGASLVVAGQVDPFGREYLDELRAQARDLPVRFELAPSQERLRELYRSCRALVFPSLNEDFGMVPLEAMACGAPVIAVDSGGPRETIVPEVSGWLVPPSADAFAAAMDAAAPQRASAMRTAARARAMEYSWDRFVARVDAVMEGVASGRSSSTGSGRTEAMQQRGDGAEHQEQVEP